MSSPASLARETCRERYGAPAVVASAPGRVNLVGGHTDYNEGFVLPVAVDRRTAVAARPRYDRTVRVRSRTYGSEATFPLDDPEPGEPAWADYVRGVAWALGDDGRRLAGADLGVASDVPVGAGLASSAALEVATAFALLAVGSPDGDDGPLIPATDRDRRAIARLCRRAESEFVGVDCGLLDQFAATLCTRDAALLLDCRSGATETVPLAPDVALLVVDTNVERALVDSAYNERRRECERGAALLAEHVGGVETLRDVSVEQFERHADALCEPVRSRCEHVVRENARVRAAAEALSTGDLRTVGELLSASHASLRDRYEVSCEELDLLVEALDRAGALGARMTGAGFGGCVVGLVDEAVVETVTSEACREYEDATGIEPDAHVCEAVDGCRVERVGET